MQTSDIIKQISQLSVEEKMLIVEQTVKLIREKEIKGKLTRAVEELREDYYSDKELTVFSEIDFESFYEPR